MLKLKILLLFLILVTTWQESFQEDPPSSQGSSDSDPTNSQKGDFPSDRDDSIPHLPGRAGSGMKGSLETTFEGSLGYEEPCLADIFLDADIRDPIFDSNVTLIKDYLGKHSCNISKFLECHLPPKWYTKERIPLLRKVAYGIDNSTRLCLCKDLVHGNWSVEKQMCEQKVRGQCNGRIVYDHESRQVYQDVLFHDYPARYTDPDTRIEIPCVENAVCNFNPNTTLLYLKGIEPNLTQEEFHQMKVKDANIDNCVCHEKFFPSEKLTCVELDEKHWETKSVYGFLLIIFGFGVYFWITLWEDNITSHRRRK